MNMRSKNLTAKAQRTRRKIMRNPGRKEARFNNSWIPFFLGSSLNLKLRDLGVLAVSSL
jgi:hypothetical protein